MSKANPPAANVGSETAWHGLGRGARDVLVGVAGIPDIVAKPLAMASGMSATPAFSATMSSPVSPITQQGTIVGTVQYMSPEQIEGKEADARSDIFAFGCVLYEMSTGKRAFDGKSNLSVASAILEKDPEPMSAVQPLTPPGLEQLVRHCLEKRPEERLQSARDIAWGLKDLSSSQFDLKALTHKSHSRAFRPSVWTAVFAALSVLLAGALFFLRAPQPRTHGCGRTCRPRHVRGCSAVRPNCGN